MSGRSTGEAEVAGEYMLVVRVRARMGEKWNGSSSLLEVAVISSSVGSTAVTVTGTRSTSSSERIRSTVESTKDPNLTSSSSSLSSHTGNNRVGLTGIVLVGLSGNETHDMPGFTSLSSTRLSGMCLRLNSPYLPCLNSRSHAVQTYSASGELRSGFPNERPVGTTGPRIFGGSAGRPGGRTGRLFLSYSLRVSLGRAECASFPSHTLLPEKHSDSY